MKDVIFINSHPIQYFAPLYAYMNKQSIKTTAWYCSDKSIRGSLDKEFGVNIKWDIPLLQGYEYRFFFNHSSRIFKETGFWGLVNFGMVKEIFRIPKSVIIVHGWNYVSHFLVIMLGKIKGHTICIRNDMPLSHELFKNGFLQNIKRVGLKYILFPRVDYFLYIGEQNRLFYKSYNLPDQQLIWCPYAVDNDRFRKLDYNVSNIKNSMGIPLNDKVILFSGKYIAKKRPLDLLNAFKRLNLENCWLILMGDGNLRGEMEDFIKVNALKNVILTGFVNQSFVSDYYAISDVFVMCSSLGENWGLSVNEAMNYDVPIILSDLTGCSDDLVIEGVNGYIYETGNVEALTQAISNILVEKRLPKQVNSKQIIDRFNYAAVTESIMKII